MAKNDLEKQCEERLKVKALEMVGHFVSGKRVFGGAFVHIPKTDFSLSLNDMCKCRGILSKLGIKMSRLDSGGSPEWGFSVIR